MDDRLLQLVIKSALRPLLELILPENLDRYAGLLANALMLMDEETRIVEWNLADAEIAAGKIPTLLQKLLAEVSDG
ncbi:MAG: hypothetical protein ACOYW9_09920 [Deinococcota bacterium]|nr:hypothetical protein [Allomeiothermus silvanus]